MNFSPMTKFKFFSWLFTRPSFGFSKKGLGLMVVLVGVVIVLGFGVRLNSAFAKSDIPGVDPFWGTCADSDTRAANGVIAEIPPEGCACNYNFTYD